MSQIHLVPNAFMQSLSLAESEGQLQKMVERFDAHKGTLAIEARRNCEEAIERQIDYIETKTGQRPKARKVELVAGAGVATTLEQARAMIAEAEKSAPKV